VSPSKLCLVCAPPRCLSTLPTSEHVLVPCCGEREGMRSKGGREGMRSKGEHEGMRSRGGRKGRRSKGEREGMRTKGK